MIKVIVVIVVIVVLLSSTGCETIRDKPPTEFIDPIPIKDTMYAHISEKGEDGDYLNNIKKGGRIESIDN